jgi:hypothetical protein
MKVKSLPKRSSTRLGQSSHLIFPRTFLVTITIFMIFQIASISVSTALAQQLESPSRINQTFTNPQKQPNFQGLLFDIDGVPFSHHMTTVNGIQMHYVIGGKGDAVVLLHGFPETWYEWRHD